MKKKRTNVLATRLSLQLLVSGGACFLQAMRGPGAHQGYDCEGQRKKDEGNARRNHQVGRCVHPDNQLTGLIS